VLAESYANNCFAEVLIEALGLNLNPFHTSKLSREKVLRKALKALEMLSDDEAELIVIDHERTLPAHHEVFDGRASLTSLANYLVPARSASFTQGSCDFAR
jgi:hypothetical protein